MRKGVDLQRRHRPIRRRLFTPLPITRALAIDHQPLTPGLRPKPDLGEAMGFYPLSTRGDDDEETD